MRDPRGGNVGKYILAQNDSTISILTTEPLAILFQLAASDTSLAEFTSDSTAFSLIESVSALTADPLLLKQMGYSSHVEKWNILNRSNVDSAPLTLRACGTYQLSPDGRTLACADEQGRLSITDVAIGTLVSEMKRFGKTDYVGYGYGIPFPTRTVGDPGSARMDFSPDGRFLIVNPWWAIGHTVTYDILKQTMVTPKGLKKDIQRYFVFVTPCSLMLGAQGSRGLLIDSPAAVN